MTYSNLTDVVMISPYSSPRTAKIDTITIHVVGNCNYAQAFPIEVEAIGREFQVANKNASSNYGIAAGKTGKARIGCFVEEGRRAWTSSNTENDNRAITIELENDGPYPYLHVSDKVIDKLIDLLVDICTRYKIEKLIWSDNKENRVGHKYGVNMTVHKDFDSRKSCPGPYVLSIEGKIAERVNKILYLKQEVEDMTREEIIKLIKDTIKETQEENNPTYETLEDIPAYWTDEIKKLIELGVLKGESSDENDNIRLNINRDTTKSMVISERLYKIVNERINNIVE